MLMIDLIFSLLGGFKGVLLTAGGLIAGLFALFWKGRYNAEKAAREEADRAISTYKAIGEIHRQDGATDATTDKQINDLRERVDHAESPEAGGGEVSRAINDYFTPEKKH